MPHDRHEIATLPLYAFATLHTTWLLDGRWQAFPVRPDSRTSIRHALLQITQQLNGRKEIVKVKMTALILIHFRQLHHDIVAQAMLGRDCSSSGVDLIARYIASVCLRNSPDLEPPPHFTGLAGMYCFMKDRPLNATIASSIDKSRPGRYLRAKEFEVAESSGRIRGQDYKEKHKLDSKQI